jgi:hypothetical protein
VTANDRLTGLRTAESEIGAQKLIKKLERSGQLKTSYLIRVLRQGQRELFDHGIATLLQLDVEPLRKALYGANPQPVALACRAAGFDRAVFPTVLELCRRHRPCGGSLSESERREIQSIFSQVAKGDALQRLRAATA